VVAAARESSTREVDYIPEQSCQSRIFFLRTAVGKASGFPLKHGHLVSHRTLLFEDSKKHLGLRSQAE
jgi:hypothetical protein